MKTLEELEAGLDAKCITVLGDTITYRPAGGAALSLKAYVNHEDVARSLDVGQAIEQQMTCEVLRSDVPARPGSAVRISLPKIPGKLFQPVNVTLSPGGTHWAFDLKAVNA